MSSCAQTSGSPSQRIAMPSRINRCSCGTPIVGGLHTDTQRTDCRYPDADVPAWRKKERRR